MLKNPIYQCKLDKDFTKDLIKISFDFKIDEITNDISKNDEFIFDDELLLVNIGEVDKFTSDYIYQSKLTVFKENDGISFGGYTPDWNRKSDLIKDKNNNHIFNAYKTYHVEMKITKYRVYIDIDNGNLKDSYGNARDKVSDLAIYANKGVKAHIENVKFTEEDLPLYEIDPLLKKMIDEKIVVNNLSYHVEEDGVYFDRLNIIQNIKCTTRNSGQYGSNIMFDMYSNTKTITIDYKIMDSEVPNYEFQFGFLVNNKNIDVPLKKVNKGERYQDTFIVDDSNNKVNRITLIFPTGFCVAIKSIKIDDNASLKPVKKDEEVIFLGDSITEGSECFNPAMTYFSKVTLHYNFIGYDFAVSGRTFNDYNLLGTYNINPKYVFLANGTNSFAMGKQEKEIAFNELEKNMTVVIKAIHNYFPKAKIIAILPIWRSDENGEKFSLLDISKKMIEIYQRYDDIHIIDAHDYIPFDASYFSNATLALHPNSKGHEIYGNKLINDLKTIIDKPKLADIKEARRCFDE
ncbi:MAG: SGNH/GDSL hydrolase family protein [Erysipelotrichaceae bacterium]|nr:SGNH/GDSL hydrolase family protein [Erysipelotrichaceae bacterium]